MLRFSFPCASGTKVGDLTDDASKEPEVIRMQIEQSGQLLVLLLLCATVLAVLMGGLITLLQKQLHADGLSSYGGKPGLASP